jgi:hypothetical protein
MKVLTDVVWAMKLGDADIKGLSDVYVDENYWHEHVLLASNQLTQDDVHNVISTHPTLVLANCEVAYRGPNYEKLWRSQHALLLTAEDFEIYQQLIEGDTVRKVQFALIEAESLGDAVYLPSPTYSYGEYEGKRVMSYHSQIQELTNLKYSYGDLKPTDELSPFGSLYLLPNGKKVIFAWSPLHVREMNRKGLQQSIAA